MTPRHWVLALLLLPAGVLAQGRTVVPGRVIVRMKAGASYHALALPQSVVTEPDLEAELAGLELARVAAPEGRELELASALAARPEVRFSAPVYRYHACL